MKVWMVKRTEERRREEKRGEERRGKEARENKKEKGNEKIPYNHKYKI